MSKNFVFAESGKSAKAEGGEALGTAAQEAGRKEADELLKQEVESGSDTDYQRNGRKVYFCSVCNKDYVQLGSFKKHEERCKALIKTRLGNASQADSELKGELERLKQQLQATQDRHLRMYEELAKQTTAAKQATAAAPKPKPDPAKIAEEEALKQQMIALTQTVGKLAESLKEPPASGATAPKAQASEQCAAAQTKQFNQAIDKAKPPAPADRPSKPLPSGCWFA